MGIADTFKALGSPVRREILILLRDGRLSAGEIGEHFDFSGATMSHHLKILKEAELVRTQRQAQKIIYSLNTTVFQEFLKSMMGMFGTQEEHHEEE